MACILPSQTACRLMPMPMLPLSLAWLSDTQGECEPSYLERAEPDSAVRWAPARSSTHAELLRVACAAVKKGDPGALVVNAGLAPTNCRGQTATDDRIHLQDMYDAGFSEAFDMLGAHPYDFSFPLHDARHAHQSLDFARLLDLRQVMVRTTTLYLRGAFEKTREERSWLQMIAVWNLATGLQANHEKRGYSVIDGLHEPRPAYVSLATMPKRGLSGQAVSGNQMPVRGKSRPQMW